MSPPPPSPPSAFAYQAAGSSPAAAAPQGVGARRWLAFAGPGLMVAVGYMDPGNWATDLAAGSGYGYRLLWIVALSGLLAMLLQGLAAKLGIATGLDLAQACRERLPRRLNIALWLLAELGICACDLAELLGSALGLKLLFGLPLLIGVALTVLDVLLVLALQRGGMRRLEALVAALIATVAVCLFVEAFMAHPQLGGVWRGLLPSSRLLSDPRALYLSVGVIGATIMPHNLYLHSALVKGRGGSARGGGAEVRRAVGLATLDSVASLGLATVVNGVILVLAGAAFHSRGMTQVGDITQAHRLLTPLLGAGAAALFALGLLASGQNSSFTATLAGQVVMEGFMQMRLAPWKRRLITRSAAVVPTLAVVAWLGDASVDRLLILSQVVLALQLPFAVIPLVLFTGDRRLMGPLANRAPTAVLAWGGALLIVLLNLVLIAQAFGLAPAA